MAYSAMAQAPERMTYQAVVRDAQNEIVANQGVTFEVSISQTSATGTVVFEESHSPITNVNGLFTVVLGTGIPVTGSLGSIDWSQGPYFLNSTVKTAQSIIQGSTQLVSVPYSFYAESAGSIANIDVYLQNNAYFDTAVTNVVNNLGISNPVVGGSVVNDSLILTLNDGTTVNAGLAQGPQGPAGADGQDGAQGPQGVAGPQGPAGADGQDGVSIVNTEILGDSLYVTLDNGQVLNAGVVSSSANNGTPNGSNNFYLGQDTLGGIVFYIYLDSAGVQHGLISDYSVSLTPWEVFNQTTLIGAGSLWDGQSNSSVILSSGVDISAFINADWYVPSIDELSLLLENRYHINKGLTSSNRPTFISNHCIYWSSTEFNNSTAYVIAPDYNGGSGNGCLPSVVLTGQKASQYWLVLIKQF